MTEAHKPHAVSSVPHYCLDAVPEFVTRLENAMPPDSSPHKTLYRYDVKTFDGEDFVDAEAHSALMGRYNNLVEQLEAYEKALRWIERFAYDQHQHHTGFTHIQRRAMTVLNPASEPFAGLPYSEQPFAGEPYQERQPE